MSPWSEWSVCSKANDIGIKKKVRSKQILVHASGGGRECTATTQSLPCNDGLSTSNYKIYIPL